MPQHDEQYWIADHTMSGASTGHSWVEGMIDYWFLTGDPWAEEVVHELAGWYCDIGESNRYGHPSQELIRRAANVGAAVLRTDELGTIGVITDGEQMWWQSHQ